MQSEVANDIRTIFNAPDRVMAEVYLVKAAARYQQTLPLIRVAGAIFPKA